ncbi:leucyl/phenylalanyl-tRNA--protein transferase [Xylophilus sp. GOD-11R]|uniref:leucyl/phenylalanyl-tRNA--protein transferase n=1 Tax=Xylophilus sp. GOD-11R TaxID=3089814 RepID=UPI00298BEAD1|nr:leucyl/phenylalanyl-tRNA--protein transferase [Xylophilus sp. GOD-11R]WPB58812.1 leucyl/phenylalanyl-tRNA--protein transferase [Xylophilus sp. GOD-11R]
MTRPLLWLRPGDAFPPLSTAWTDDDPAAGLLAAGGSLEVRQLMRAYGSGIFPWFSEGQPILWWSPDPRMVLRTADFRLHRSLRKVLQAFRDDAGCEIRIDHDFAATIKACASAPRAGQNGTWILPDMVNAYIALHRAGHAHSVETWIDGELAGGLYCVNVGRAVFGESMFARRTDASKIALSALVAFCRAQHVDMIDCQQNTRHLASLGAAEMPRGEFAAALADRTPKPAPRWEFTPVYWRELLPGPPSA